MSPDHWILVLLLVATLLYLAWSAARLRAGMQQDRAAILAAMRPLQESSERITRIAENVAQMVRDLHNR